VTKAIVKITNTFTYTAKTKLLFSKQLGYWLHDYPSHAIQRM